jgi:hypothetical protein
MAELRPPREEAPEGQAHTISAPWDAAPEPPGTVRVLPMQLRIGDQITDEMMTVAGIVTLVAALTAWVIFLWPAYWD